jgi:hypothetical protein
MKLSEISHQLKDWFPASDHKKRKVPGGKEWWYVPWQLIRQRLDRVCPDEWTVEYGQPYYLGDLCHISCRLTICGIAREGVGSAKLELISNEGNDMARGNPIERAVADAFKNAAEQFGIAGYLDEQTDDKTKKAFIKYMLQAGDARPAVQLQNKMRAEAGLPVRPKAVDPLPESFPGNLERFRALTNLLQVPKMKRDELIKSAIASRFPGLKSTQLAPLQAQKVISQILINYGALSVGETEAELLYHTAIASDPKFESADDESLAIAWLGCLSKLKREA